MNLNDFHKRAAASCSFVCSVGHPNPVGMCTHVTRVICYVFETTGTLLFQAKFGYCPGRIHSPCHVVRPGNVQPTSSSSTSSSSSSTTTASTDNYAMNEEEVIVSTTTTKTHPIPNSTEVNNFQPQVFVSTTTTTTTTKRFHVSTTTASLDKVTKPTNSSPVSTGTNKFKELWSEFIEELPGYIMGLVSLIALVIIAAICKNRKFCGICKRRVQNPPSSSSPSSIVNVDPDVRPKTSVSVKGKKLGGKRRRRSSLNTKIRKATLTRNPTSDNPILNAVQTVTNEIVDQVVNNLDDEGNGKFYEDVENPSGGCQMTTSITDSSFENENEQTVLEPNLLEKLENRKSLDSGIELTVQQQKSELHPLTPVDEMEESHYRNIVDNFNYSFDPSRVSTPNKSTATVTTNLSLDSSQALLLPQPLRDSPPQRRSARTKKPLVKLNM